MLIECRRDMFLNYYSEVKFSQVLFITNTYVDSHIDHVHMTISIQTQ